MEIKNKKWMFVLILLVLALVSAVVVEAQLGFMLRESNIGLYFGGKMIANYIIVFAILFIIVYFVAFSKETRPGGLLLYLFLIALFVVSIVLTIIITKGTIAEKGVSVFIWEVAKLTSVRWLFKIKTIVNALIIAGICLVVKTYGLKEYGKEKAGMVATVFIIILISLFVASMINYSAVQPKELPEDVTYNAEEKYVDRWIWQYDQVKKMKLFLLGDEPGGSYTNEKGELKQGILKFGENGKGLPAFFIGSLLLLWLFIHFEIFKKGGGKLFQYGIPILLAALMANEGYTKTSVMGYAWWTALIIINRSFKNTWGRDRPGMAFGLAFAIVQTTYTAIVGEPYLKIGTDSFAANFIIGIGVGFLWDILLGKSGLWEAQARRTEAFKTRFSDLWEKDRVKAIRYGLGEALNTLSAGQLARWGRFRRFMGEYTPIEFEILKLQKDAEKTLRDLIEEEKKTGAARRPAEINRLRTEFNDKIQRIEALNRRIARLRGGP